MLNLFCIYPSILRMTQAQRALRAHMRFFFCEVIGWEHDVYFFWLHLFSRCVLSCRGCSACASGSVWRLFSSVRPLSTTPSNSTRVWGPDGPPSTWSVRPPQVFFSPPLLLSCYGCDSLSHPHWRWTCSGISFSLAPEQTGLGSSCVWLDSRQFAFVARH